MLMDVHQRGNLRFPQSLPEFQRLFPDDAACAGYLEKARWSDGFVCPHCQAAGEPFRFANRPGVLRCRRCRRDTPLSSASTGGSSTPSVPCSASRATSPHRPTQSFTPEPGSTLHVGGVGNNRIGKDIMLALPLRPQNLNRLNWRHNFSEPNGPRGQLRLHIAAHDTKTKRRDIDSEVPDDVARRLRWYRRQILPRLGADANGYLFVTRKGDRKGQTTLTLQITNALARHIGVHMTPHQFRHFGATSYLEQHPEDFETVRELLSHAWSKTTRIYAGSSSRRASRAYNQFLFKRREDLKLPRPRRKRRG